MATKNRAHTLFLFKNALSAGHIAAILAYNMTRLNTDIYRTWGRMIPSTDGAGRGI